MPEWTRRIRDQIAKEPIGTIAGLITFAFTVFTFWSQQIDQKRLREITEINRVYDSHFMNSLSEILKISYSFLDDDENCPLPEKVRYEKFWELAGAEGDRHMFIVFTRLQSLEQCVAQDYCDREMVYSMFSNPIHQSLMHLKAFISPSDNAYRENWEGWRLGENMRLFLLDGYEQWHRRRYNEAPSPWSSRYLSKQQHDSCPGSEAQKG